MQTFSLVSAKFREALLQLSCSTWEGKSHSWGWMDETASGLSSQCAERREKILAVLDTWLLWTVSRSVAQFCHLKHPPCDAFITSSSLFAPGPPAADTLHPPTHKKPQQSPTLEGALLGETAPPTAPSREPLPSLTRLDVRPPRVAAQRDAGTPNSCTAGTRDVCKGENSRTNCKRAGGRQKPGLNI